MKINAALCTERKHGSRFKKAKQRHEADYLTSPLLLKSPLEAGAGSKTGVTWEGLTWGSQLDATL